MPANVWLLLALVACAMAGNGLIVPILPIYGELFSSSATLVGMLITIFGVTRLASNLPTGLVYPRLGARRLIIAGNGLLTIGAVGAALAPDLMLLLAARAVQGIGSGIFLTSMGVLVARLSRDGSRGRFMARYQTAIFVGAGIGPAIGGWIAEHLGMAAPFWAYALVSALGVMAALTIPDEAAPATSATTSVAQERWTSLLSNPIQRANLLVGFASGFVRTAALWQLIPLLAAARFQMGFDQIGLAVTITAFANVAILPVSGRLVDRFGWRWLPTFASFGYAASFALIALSPGEAGFWTGVVLAGIFGGLIGPASSTALIEVTAPPLLPAATGAQRTFTDLGFVAGPLVMGLLADLLGLTPDMGLLLTAALLLVSGVIWLMAQSSLGADIPRIAASSDKDGALRG